MHRLHTRFVLALSLLLTLASSSLAAAVWPGLRGPNYDGAVRGVDLFAGEPGLSVAWERELGSGYPVVAADEARLFVAFQAGDHDVIAAFDVETGEELWRYAIGEAYAGHTGSHDGPIATPALGGDRVFALGPWGQLVALEAESGEPVWTRHLGDEFGAEAPYYGFGASPLVAGEVLVVQIGAEESKSIGGFDAATGELLWSTGEETVEYNSPILATLGGRTQVVAASTKHLRGLDPESGTVLWSHEHGGDERAMGGATIVPIPAGENRLLLLHRHPESVMLEIEPDSDGEWSISELWTSNSIKSTYVQPVYHDGFIYGMNSKIFACVDAATGEIRWRAREAGDGFPTVVGDHLVIMSKAGILRVAEASPEGYHELASLELFDDVSWSAPAFANGSLYLRSMGELARVDPVAATADDEPEAAAFGETRFGSFLAAVTAAEDSAKNALVDEFLARNPEMPVIEDSGAVHFLYRGEAEDVGIVGDMIGFRREDPMTRIAGTDLFYYSTRLEPDAAVHYGFLVDYGEPTPDPMNSRTGDGLFGEISFFTMPAYRTVDYPEAAPERQGRLEEVSWESEVMEGKTRQAVVYLPAGYDPASDRRYPTLYVHDGRDALDDGGFQQALDASIGESAEPVIAIFVIMDEEANRGEFRSPAYAEMLSTELVPLIDERYATIQDPMARASAGTGSAADLSFQMAFQPSAPFARVGSIWASFFGFAAEIPAATDDPLVVYQRWGAYHLRSPHENFDSAEANREFWASLRQKGQRPAGGEVPEGFGWNCWRGYVGEMLATLFPLR